MTAPTLEELEAWLKVAFRSPVRSVTVSEDMVRPDGNFLVTFEVGEGHNCRMVQFKVSDHQEEEMGKPYWPSDHV